jgi:hypothetical protein
MSFIKGLLRNCLLPRANVNCYRMLYLCIRSGGAVRRAGRGAQVSVTPHFNRDLSWGNVNDSGLWAAGEHCGGDAVGGYCVDMQVPADRGEN